MVKVEIEIGTCSGCGQPWPQCGCGTWHPPPMLEADGEIGAEEPRDLPLDDDGKSGRLVEWVQWRSGAGLSRYHVRVSTGGFLLCGRRVPVFAAADSFPPPRERCAVCLTKLRALAS